MKQRAESVTGGGDRVLEVVVIVVLDQEVGIPVPGLELLIDDEGNLKVDTEDEIIAGSLLTKDGEIVNERAKEAANQ